MSRPEDRPNAVETPPTAPGTRRFWLGLGGITLLALAWRVGYVIKEIGRIPLNGDAAYYHWQSILISKGFGFIDPGQYELFGRVTPSAGHPPVYLLYLAAVSRFIGTSQTTQRLASTLLGAGAVFFLGVIARRLFRSDWAGWLAALLAAGYANLWINDEMLMSESMYILATAFAVWAAYRFWDKPSARSAAVMGIGIAFAALSRAEAVALFPFLAIPFGFLAARRRSRDRAERHTDWRLGARWALAACVAGGLLMAPWVLYNLTRFDHPVEVSNGVGSVLMVANCDATVPAGQPDAGTYIGTYHGMYVGYWSGVGCATHLHARIDKFFSGERARYLKEQVGDIPGTDVNFFGDESTHEYAWRAIGIADMKHHMSQMPRVVVFRVARMWDLFRPRQNIQFNGVLEGRGVWQSRLAEYQYYPLLALSILGLVILRRRRVPILPFLAIAATITITAATSFGITRYRAPVDAMLPVLAGGAIVWLYQWISARVEARRSTSAPELATQ